MAKHYGSFAKGFSDSIIAMMKLYLTQQHYEALNKHYAAQEELWANRGLGRNKGLSPEARAAGEEAGRDWDKGGGGNAAAPTPGGDGYVSMAQMVDMAQKAGFKGDDAAHMAALAYAESQGHIGAVGGAGEIGITQINPHAWGALADKARTAQGAMDAAKVVYDKQGWGAWSTDPSSANFTPGNNGLRYIKAARAALPASGEGDKPTKVATAEEAETSAKDGGFRIPGSDPASAQAGSSPASDLPYGGPRPGAEPLPDNAKMIDGTMGPPQQPAGREDPEIAARQAHGQGTLPPARQYHSLQPQDQPLSGVGVSTQRRTAEQPHSTGLTPVPEEPAAIPREAGPDISLRGNQSTINPQTDRSPVNQYGPAIPPDGLAKAQEADKPSVNATPVSSPARPGQSNSQSNNGIVVDTAPNSDPNARNRPQMGMLDLSHLWGPNPPLSQRQAAPAPTPARRPDDLDVPNLKDSDFSGLTDQQVMGAAKGGTVRGYAAGGAIPASPMMGYAVGGLATNPNPSAYMGQQPSTVYTSTTPIVGQTQAAMQNMMKTAGGFANMTPEQQAWYNSNGQILANYGLNAGRVQTAAGQWLNGPQYQRQDQFSGVLNPTFAATPAPAPTPAPVTPAAPTPAPVITSPTVQNITAPQVDTTVTDPTTTTVTGAPNLPNSIQAKSYDPNVDQQTGAGFTNTNNAGGTDYSVGSDDLLKQNEKGDISGSTILSAKGGPITPRVKFDDGGGVNPSAAGMPPGLGGQPAIPPIYFNPATYSAAGAPVGKGISAASAPTASAGAIPNLPLARGGSVKFADGGEVDDPNEDRQVASDDAMTTQLLASNDAATPTNAYFTPNDYQTPPAPTQQSQPSSSSVSPVTPEISDGQGNPSKGLIGAISDGMHWLGDHLGLVGGAQAHPAMASNPETATNRANFPKQNVGGMDASQHAQLGKMIDPNDTLDHAERNIAVMEGTYRYMLSQGDAAGAGKMAASILQYSVQTSQRFAEEASKQLYDGNLKSAADNINHASDAIPDGRHVHVKLNDDGTAIVTGTDLNGRTLWQQKGAASAILQYATNRGRTGQMQWDSLEEQAAKYDPTFAQMAKNRQGNIVGQAKDNADKEAQAAANDQIARLGPQFGGADSGGVAPAATPGPPTPKGPAVQTASTAPEQGAPPTPDSRGTAQQNAPPPDADSNAGVGGYSPSNLGGALPATADDDIPAAGSQPVDMEHDVGYQNIVAQTQLKYFTPDGRPLIGRQPMNRPPTIDSVTLKSYAPQVQAAYKERWDQYRQAVQENQRLMTQDVDGQRRDYTAGRTTTATAQSQAHSDAAAAARQKHSDEAAATLEQNKEKDADKKQQSGWQHSEQAPMAPEQVDRTFKEHDPTAIMSALPRNAVYKGDGTLDEGASLKATMKNYDIGAPGQPAAGGLGRVTRLGDAVRNIQTWNTHLGANQLGDLTDGLARGIYTTDPNPPTVDHGYGPMTQWTVHRQPGDPGVQLLVPNADRATIVGIRREFANAQVKPPAAGAPAPAPSSSQSFPGTSSGGAPPAGGFNQPAMPPSPNTQWWMDQLLGRNRTSHGLTN